MKILVALTGPLVEDVALERLSYLTACGDLKMNLFRNLLRVGIKTTVSDDIWA